eukprot:4846184-Alexandrium_andersonii.AAC.1
MSASLVGSEMCIRDSLDRTAAELPAGHAPAARRQQLRTGLFGPIEDAWPVSYTHLTLPTICSV